MLFKNNKLLLAPMAGITDSVFRYICREQGADITVSEMVSAEGMLHHSQNTADLLFFKESERPVGIQLFGADPEHISAAAKIVEELVHPDFIDLNAGCPVPKVVKKNGGSALLRNKNLFENILKSLVKAVSIPVTVKIRSGWHMHEWVDTEFAKIAEQCGVSAITLHPRSQTMGFSGHSYWERIAIVKQSVKIPVIGNGDITSPEAAVKMKQETDCDCLMIGRGAYGNPWIFRQIKEAFENKQPCGICTAEKKSMALRHLELFKNQFGEKQAVKEMKKHIAWYIKGLPDATMHRNQIFRSDSYQSLLEIIEKM